MSESGIGLILQSPTRKLIEQAIHLSFSASNNETEYEVVLAEQDLALVLEGTKLEIRSDSHLIVEQIQREYETNDERMARYLAVVESHLKKLDYWVIRRVPREENEKADALAGITVTLPIKEAVMLPVYLKVAPSITPEPVCNTSHTDAGWMLNIMKYLQTREVPRDEKQAHKLHIQATRFTLINDQLYRRSFGGSYLKCLSEPGAKYIMAELH